MIKIATSDDYFQNGCGRCERFSTPECATQVWRTELAVLRQLCLSLGLQEVLKWGCPCYVHAGRNIAIVGALRQSLCIGFFDAALLSDPQGLLQRAGPRARQADVLRFRSSEELAAQAATVQDLLQQAMACAQVGQRPDKTAREPLSLPDELRLALAEDAELAWAFERLTPGRQRSYVIHLEAAKKPQTRLSRLANLRSHILAGKGVSER